MKTQNIFSTIALSILLASCSFGPTAKLADGSMITTGGSLLTSGQSDSRKAAHPNGLALSWDRVNYEETSVAKTGLGVWGSVEAIRSWVSVKNTTTLQNGKNLKTTTDGATAATALSKVPVGAPATITAPGVKIVPIP